jgi:ribosome-associated translation inhibitor RaiA
LHVYLTARHLELDDPTREYVERHLVRPVGAYARLHAKRMQIHLSKDAERGHHYECHVVIELKRGRTLNIRERDPVLNAAIDQCSDRVVNNLTEMKDRMLTTTRHPKKYSLARIARALGWLTRKRAPV